MKKTIEPAFEDERGLIADVFVGSPKDHCAMITFRKGAVRANHFHKLSTQFTFVVSGRLKAVTVRVDDAGVPLEAPQQHTLQALDLCTHPPYEAHAFQAIEDTVILAFACGIRGGEDYEKDVYRLGTKLL